MRASKTFSKFCAFRSSVRFEVPCASKFSALRSSVRFEVQCVSKFRVLRSSVCFEVPCASKFRVRTISSNIYTIQCVYSIQYTPYTIHYTVHYIVCTHYTVHYIVCTHYTVRISYMRVSEKQISQLISTRVFNHIITVEYNELYFKLERNIHIQYTICANEHLYSFVNFKGALNYKFYYI